MAGCVAAPCVPGLGGCMGRACGTSEVVFACINGALAAWSFSFCAISLLVGGSGGSLFGSYAGAVRLPAEA